MSAPTNQTAGASRFALVATACLIALIIVGALVVRWFLVETPASGAERAIGIARAVAADVSKTLQFQPTVVVNNRTIVQQDAAVAKLVTIERPLTETHSYEHRWMGSTKRIDVEGDFVLRAGFDLSKPFVLRVDPDTGRIIAKLPPAEVLSVELTDLRILRDEDGWINQITGEDREAAIDTLRDRATLHAMESNLLEEARLSVERRLQTILASEGREVSFEPGPTPLP